MCAFAVFGSPGRKTYYVNPNDAHLKVKIPALLDSPVVGEVAQKHNKNAAQILLRYFAQQGVVVLAKSVTAERIKSNYQVTTKKKTLFREKHNGTVLHLAFLSSIYNNADIRL